MAVHQDKTRGFALRKQQVIESYPAVMEQLFLAWKKPAPALVRGWLIYAASYLFSTYDVRWMIDPVRLKHRLLAAPEFDFTQHLADLDFVLLTHQHSDHFDLELIEQIKHLPRKWVIPEFLLPRLEELKDFPWERVVVPTPLSPFRFSGITITVFDGLHWEKVQTADAKYPAGVYRGVPSLGYLIELKDQRWLFPGDTRTYDLNRLPDFGPVDLLFAHLWLGRGQALVEDPLLLEKFCQFMLGLRPRKMILTHLEEFGRQTDDYWDLSHVPRVESWFHQLTPEIQITSALLGDQLSI